MGSIVDFCKLAELRARTDRDLVRILTADLDRSLALANVAAGKHSVFRAEAEAVYKRAQTLLPKLCGLTGQRAGLEGKLKELGMALDLVPGTMDLEPETSISRGCITMSTRRHFLQASTFAGWAASAMAAQDDADKKISPTDRIRVALIGAGGMGTGDAEASQKVPGVELVAVSDIYEGRLTRAKERWGNQLYTTRDYREVLARSDVDAVLIATPDHWHAKIA
ncbi:MAG TPA: Gfo/Idh/MocA family oxidoreductase, partial [Bryobacteraceae bacterium]|nr:Gfo/Idh/MocA family oxidoreductase [Bryobacteraceae bacterium]